MPPHCTPAHPLSFPLSGDECFIECCREFHGVDISMDDVRALHAYDAELRRGSATRDAFLKSGSEITSYTADWEIDNGKNFGKILGTIISVGVSAATGQWWAAGLALLSGVVSLLEKPPSTAQEERFDEKQGFEQGGALAPSGGVLPRIYCNRNINPSGGVRVGGILIHSRVDIRRGSSYLYQLYALSAGESPTLGWGKMGSIDNQATLFNRQPRRNFNNREISTYSRLGSRAQSAIPQFAYYCQNITPPDYRVFGVDRRAQIGSFSTTTTANASTTNATIGANGVITKTSGSSTWNAGYFGNTGLAGPGGVMGFSNPTGVLGVGLSSIDQDNDVASIAFGFSHLANGTTVVIESGIPRTVPFATGTNYQIQPRATGVDYYVDGALVYAGALAPTYPLYPDVALYSPGSSVFTPYIPGATAILGSTTGSTASTITPTPNQSSTSQDQDTLSLFNSGQDYTVAISGETTRDPKFNIVDKDSASKSFTTNPAITGEPGNSIYAYWWARYETTKRVDRFDVNMQFSLSARHKGNSSNDSNEGKLVTHGSLFDLWMRPANSPTGSEVFVIRLLVKNRGTQRIFRAFQVRDLALGRYYFELRPLTFCPYDVAKKIYELTDNGYGSDESLDAEDLPIIDPGVTIAGNAIRIQGELELVSNGAVNPTGPAAGYQGNPDILQVSPTVLDVNFPPQTAQSATAISPGQTYTVEMGSNFPQNSGITTYGMASASGTLLYGFKVTRAGYNTQVIKVVGGVDQPPVSLFSYPVTLTYSIAGNDALLGIDGVNTIHPITPIQPLFNLVKFNQDGYFPAPVNSTAVAATVTNIYSLPQIDEWIGYNKKTQVSSESAPTGTILSVNEIVHPVSIGKPPPTYAGIATQGYRFLASERLQQAPGTRALIPLGTECPNWIAAGNALQGSGGNVLTVSDSNFTAAGVIPGYYVRNLDKKITGRVTAATANTLTTNIPMGWQGGGYCGDRYAVYFIGATCFLPDIYVDLMSNDYGGIPELIDPDEYIDYPSIVASRKFCEVNKYYFDDVIEERMPIAEWITKHARLSYLFPIQVDGRYGLIPDRQRPIDAVFNAGNSRNFTLDYPDFQPNLTNTIVLRYVDGRDEFTQSGVRHRTVTITIQTTAAFNGAESPVTEEVEGRSIKNLEQAISVGCLYLKTLRQNTIALSWESSYAAFYTQAGDIVSVQAPSLGIESDYSGSVAEVAYDAALTNPWRVRLDCQPVVKTGYQPIAAPTGIAGIDNSANSIAPGFLLVNEDSGEYGLITAADDTTISAPIVVPLGDEYAVLSAIQANYEAQINYRETGTVQEIANPSTEFIDGVAWVRLPGASEAPEILDFVNIHPRNEQYRLLSVQPSGREVFQLNAVLHDPTIYDRDGLVIQFDDSVLGN